MNQILYAEEDKKNSQIDIKKVALFFAVAIVMLGIVLISMSGYSLNINKKNAKVVHEEENQNNISIELKKAENNKVMIKVESEIAVAHIIYSWNDESSKTLEETGKTNIEEILEIPIGENTLRVSVIDVNGVETKSNKTFTRESSKPVIGAGTVIGNYYKIIVTSENELTYVSYKWNNENEVKEDLYTYEEKNTFEKEIKIPTGVNTLVINAVDTLGNSTTSTINITGYQKPVTNVVTENGYFHFTVTGIDNIETVEFVINNKKYIMNTSTFGDTMQVTYQVKMQEGTNYLEITATTVNGASDTSYWKADL